MAARVLVHPRADAWLVGWVAVLAWVAARAAQHEHVLVSSGLGWSALIWVGVVLSAAHFGLSYHLAYRTRDAVKEHPVVLAWAPLALGLLLLGIGIADVSGAVGSRQLTRAALTSVFLMTTWHYVKQVYGVARVSGGVRLTAREGQVLRFGLYPLWFAGATQVLVRGANYSQSGFSVGFDLLPHWVPTTLRVFAVLTLVPVAQVLLRAKAPAVMVAPYIAALLWLGLAPEPALTVLALAPLHALQYLAVGHRAELAIAERVDPIWWLNVFAGAACGGLLILRWVPQALDARVGGSGQPLVFAALFFVFLNLHHYLIDATIWRSDGAVVKAMVARPTTAVAVS